MIPHTYPLDLPYHLALPAPSMEEIYGNKRPYSLVKALRDTLNTQLDTLDLQLNQEDDPADLGGLERQLSAVQKFATASNHAADNMRAQLARDWNRNLPVHRFPNELFTHILMQIRETSKDLDTRSVIRWTTVCSIWRHVIIGTPSMWRRIDLRDGYLSFLALTRSKSAPLEIHWDESSWESDGYSSPELMLMPAVFYNLARSCRGLYLKVLTMSDVAQELLTICGAHATIIDISALDDYHPYIALSDGPNLQLLALMNVVVPLETWSSPRLSGLRFLLLQGLGGFPTDDQFYRMLASAPFLSTMALDSVDYSSDVDHQDLSPTTSSLQLPNMELLSVETVPRRLHKFLLRYLECPNCEYITILDISSEDVVPVPVFLQSLRPSALTPWKLAAELDTDSITICNQEPDVTPWPLEYNLTNGPPSNFYISICVEHGDSWENTISALSTWISDVHHLEITYQGPDFHPLLRCRSVWSRVHSVDLQGPSSFLIQAIHLLSQPQSQTTSKNPSDVLFLAPKLSRLSVDVQTPEEPLEEVVEEIVWLVRTHFSLEDAAGAPTLQMVGHEGILGLLRTKDLPLNIVLESKHV